MALEERTKKFIEDLGIPITRFCNNVGLSRTSVYDWLSGRRKPSQAALDRIEGFISKYGF